MGTAVQTAPKNGNTPPTVRDLIQGDAFKAAVTAALPKHLKPDRFIRIALTAMTRTPKLQQCDQGSFFGSLLTLSQFGIEPDGRRGALVPFNNRKRGIVECQAIVMYQGLAELVKRSGAVSTIYAKEVCENDQFSYENGVVRHSIDLRNPRGKVYAFCAQIKFKDGSEQGDVMTLEEVSVVRQRSRAKDDGPWAGFPKLLKGETVMSAEMADAIEMSKKTIFRRLTKWVELSPEIRAVVEADDDQFEHGKILGGGESKTLTLDALAQLPEIEPEGESQDGEDQRQTLADKIVARAGVDKFNAAMQARKIAALADATVEQLREIKDELGC